MKNAHIVMSHYEKENLAARIMEAVGKTEGLTLADLEQHDELHIGGRAATRYFMEGMALEGRVLDVGCGIGGAARFAASVSSATHVTGIDLTPAFIEAAEILTDKTGLSDRVSFHCGNALAMPFDDGQFDSAYTIHTGMNIENKATLYREIHRVLKPGGCFGLYDILADEQQTPMTFPVPWSAQAETSFLVSSEALEAILSDAGFEITRTENRRDYALQSFIPYKKAKAAGPLTPSPSRSPDYFRQLDNLIENVEAKRCGPWIVMCRKGY